MRMCEIIFTIHYLINIGGINMQSRNSTLFILHFAIAMAFTMLLSINLGFTEEHGKHDEHQASNAAELNVKLHTEPQKIEVGKPVTMMFHLTDAKDEPVTDLMVHHDRILHVLIVSEDLQIIGHIHPEDFESRDMMAELEGVYTVHFTFPVAGRYILALDVMTADAEISKHLYVDVEGENKMQEITHDLRTEKDIFGYKEEGGDRFTKAVSIRDKMDKSPYEVKIEVPEQIKVGEMVRMKYHFSLDSKPITDLVPFLDAPMHFAIVSTYLDGILHTHGTVPMNGHKDKEMKKDPHAQHKMKKEPASGHQHQGPTPEKFGPTVMLMTTFPKAGHYQIFGQLKHKDQILFPTFMVKVVE